MTNDSLPIVTQFFVDNPVTGVQIQSYNDFVDFAIDEVVADVRPIVWFDRDNRNKTIKISMDNARLVKPTTTPRLCRQLLKSYTSTLLVDLSVCVSGTVSVKQQVATAVSLGEIPVMVGSKICPIGLGDISAAESEEIDDDVGFFVINGQEKVIISQEKVASNVPVLFKLHAYNASTVYVCEIRSSSSHIKIPVTFSVRLHEVMQCASSAVFCVLSFFRTDVPLFLLLYALGATSIEEIVCEIARFSSAPCDEIYKFLEPSLREVTLQTQMEALHFLGGQMGPSSNTEACNQASDVLNTSLLPHLPFAAKMQYVLHMVALLFIYTVRGSTEDRDTLASKRIETSGVLVSQQLRQSIQKARSNIERNLAKSMTSNERLIEAFVRCDTEIVTSCVISFFVSHTITKPLMYTMATGNIQLQATGSVGGQRTGVVQLYCRYNIITCLSQLRRVNTPIERVGKASKPRIVHHSQCGFLCPVETPEGPSCGLIKNLALGAIITTFRHSKHGTAAEQKITPLVYQHRSDDGVCVFYNGVVLGFVADGPLFVNQIRLMKMSEESFFASLLSVYVSYDRHVYIHTEEGRVVRFFLMPHTKTSDLECLGRMKWEEMLASGFFVYADAAEAVTHNISLSIETVQRDTTLCEIHPMLLLGVTASTIPFIQCNQSPRNTYQTSMTKQSLGSRCVHDSQSDALTPSLAYSQRPLVSGASNLLLPGDQCQLGANWLVAVQSDAGNQNDSIVLNRSSVERGMGLSLHTAVVKIELRHPETLRCVIDLRQPPTIRIGATVSMGTTLFEYVNTNTDVVHAYNYKGDDSGRVTGVDLIVGGQSFVQQKDGTYTINGLMSADSATCMKNYYVKCAYRNMIIRIKLGTGRVPEVGDKFASRHGQKGTVGALVCMADMPFCSDGTVPDILFNAHGIPSRMTIGQLWEQVFSKLQAMIGQISSVGAAFNTCGELSQLQHLRLHGYSPSGKEKMFSGVSGAPLEGTVYLGLVYYQRLKHMVRDKVHARALGPITQLVRQPTDGRSRNGGLRIGEMERDCIIGHGAIAFLRERLLWKSDAFQMLVCSACGHMCATSDVCIVCKKSDCLRQITIPYATKLLLQEITAIGIQPKLHIVDCAH